jgi:hypothetical protein
VGQSIASRTATKKTLALTIPQVEDELLIDRQGCLAGIWNNRNAIAQCFIRHIRPIVISGKEITRVVALDAKCPLKVTDAIAIRVVFVPHGFSIIFHHLHRSNEQYWDFRFIFFYAR